MSASPHQDLNAQVARALAQSEHLRIDPSRLEDVPGYPLMSGGFGTVRVAKLDDEIVAIKELRITGADIDRARLSMRFARELHVWTRLSHPNLLKLTGFYTDPYMFIAQFICPFYANGHIRNYIEINKPDQDIRLKLAEDTALGLQHLHHLNIAHGDLKELNVLIDPEPRALLCDYGLARMMNPDGNKSGLTTSGMPLSIRYASPELLKGARPDLKSDIWAWGCLFLQIVADVGPYDGSPDVMCMIGIVQGTPPANVSTLNMFANLRIMLEICWHQDPLERPDIGHCIEVLVSMRSRQQPGKRRFKKEELWAPSSEISVATLEGHANRVETVSFSPDGSLLASGSRDHTVHLWDVKSGVAVVTLNCHSTACDGPACENIYDLAFSPTGTRLVAGVGFSQTDGGIWIWDASPESSTKPSGSHTSWQETSTIPTLADLRSLALSPDGSRIATASADGKLQLWDGGSGTLMLTLKLHDRPMAAVTFSPDGVWLASCIYGKSAQVWDTDTMIAVGMDSEQQSVANLAEARCVAFSPNGRWLASGADNGVIRLWELPSWRPVATLVNGSAIVVSLAFSPDSTRLASGTSLGPMIWDMASMKLSIRLKEHRTWISSVAFSPDGKRLAISRDNDVSMCQATSSTESDEENNSTA